MFYIFEVSHGESRIEGKAVYTQDDFVKAEAMYHQKIATAMNSELYTEHLCMVIDENGAVSMAHKFVRPVEVAPVEPEADAE